ncbi:MAG: CDP-alcohol phosphatidyltransferase family protein [Aquificae bacterium]|jgi:phosphatidylglycerophosphate synthase|nr:CDP-alcohol phosphatidyltransferase family protein [Aquificota bacterium]
MNLTSKREILKKIYEPVGLSLAYLNIPPNAITFFSIVAGALSAWAFYTHHVLTGATLLAISGLLDLADGIVARKNDQATKFGAVLDWLADKFIDGLVLGAVAVAYANPWVAIVLITVNMLHTFIKPVAYAEIGFSQREKGKIWDPLEGTGFFGRPETHLAIIIFAILERFICGAMTVGVYLITLLTTLSLLHRVYYLYRRFGRDFD